MFCKLVLFFVAAAYVFAAPTDVVPLEKQQPTVIPIVSQSEELEPNGTYKYSYETGNGIKREEISFDKVVPKLRTKSSSSEEGGEDSSDSDEIHVQQGSYSYTAPDGTLITLRYIADENGFQPIGDHIPKAPGLVSVSSSSSEKSGRALNADSAEGGSVQSAVVAPLQPAVPAPAVPAPAVPAPAVPAPAEPAPVEPVPAEPAPVEPVPAAAALSAAPESEPTVNSVEAAQTNAAPPATSSEELPAAVPSSVDSPSVPATSAASEIAPAEATTTVTSTESATSTEPASTTALSDATTSSNQASTTASAESTSSEVVSTTAAETPSTPEVAASAAVPEASISSELALTVAPESSAEVSTTEAAKTA